MAEPLALVLSLLALAATLATAVARPPWLPEAAVAAGGGALLVALGAISFTGARHALGALGPTVGFLAALLVLAEGCRRERVFTATGARMALASRGRATRLLALTFAASAAVTAVLGLDATVVLLTPVVFATAARLPTSPKPHVYACTHLANSASLLLVVSNLTNLLAFRASGLSFTRFAALMALPWLAVIGVEWVVLRRFFAVELDRPQLSAPTEPGGRGQPPVPRFALAVLGLTLAGFAVSSPLGIAPVWFAAAGATAITLPALLRSAATPLSVLRAAEPGFLVFVLGLGVIVAVASDNGLRSAVIAVLPTGRSLPDLLAIAALGAVLANLLNNLPATLILAPVAAAIGTGPLLAVLIGVNVGPEFDLCGLPRNVALAAGAARAGCRRGARRAHAPRPPHRAGGGPTGDGRPMVRCASLELRCECWCGWWRTRGSRQSCRRSPPHPSAPITLLFVIDADVEEVALGARAGLLGRRHGPPPPQEPPVSTISEEAARALLREAESRVGRPVAHELRRGRVEHEVVAAAATADLLVMARDGDRSRLGPRSVGPHARFVLDHAPCRVLLVWPEHTPSVSTLPPPPR